MSDSSRTAIAALLTNDVLLIDEISRFITEAHFPDPTLRSLFRSIVTFRSAADGVLTSSAVDDLTRDTDAGTAALIRETYDALVMQGGSPADARWAAEVLRRDRERWLTQTALRDSTEILNGRMPDPDGSGREWSGAADAREWLSARLSEIETEVSIENSPAGDVSLEMEDILSTYAHARAEDKSRRFMSGIPKLDEVSGGFGPGEMILVAAPTGMGKSHFVTWCSYHAAVRQGLSIYFATSETVRSTVRCRLMSLHSRHEKFAEIREFLNLPYGLNSNDISRGALTEQEYQFLELVVQDFSKIDGSIWLAQIPHGQTVATLGASMAVRHRMRSLDGCVMDYAALLSSVRRRAQTHEELSAILKDGKHLAIDFDKGRGIPFITPWQFNREALKEIERTGEIDFSTGLAGTKESGDTSDMVMSLSPDGTRSERHANLHLGVLKNRDGAVLLGGNAVPIRVDYATSYFEQRMGADSSSSWDPSGQANDPLLSLLN